MKQYQWQGITKLGVEVKGISRAGSVSELHIILFADGIGLLECSEVSGIETGKRYGLFLSLSQRARFFEMLGTLLASGIEIDVALEVIRPSLRCFRSYGWWKRVSIDQSVSMLLEGLREGKAFSHMCLVLEIIEPAQSAMIAAGESAGAVAIVLHLLAKHFLEQEQLIQRLKDAAMVPVLTLGCSGVIFFGICSSIMPRFESFFFTLEKPLPVLTKKIFAISHFVTSTEFCGVGLILFLGGVCMFYIRDNSIIKSISRVVCRMVPPVRNVYEQWDVIVYVRNLKMLLSCGISQKSALEMSSQVVSGSDFLVVCKKIVDSVMHGDLLWQALQRDGAYFFPAEVIALIAAGERAGVLVSMLERVEQILILSYNQKIERFVRLFGPILIILVGCFVAIVLLAVYLPLFSLAHSL